MSAVFEGAHVAPVPASSAAADHVRHEERLAVIVPRLPYPARRDGMAVRYCPVLDHFASQGPLEVVVLGPPGDELPADAPAWARDAIYLELPPASAQPLVVKLATFARACRPGGHPRSQSVHRAPRLAEDLAGLLRARRIRMALWVGPGGIDLAERVRRLTPGMRWIVDFIDSPSRLIRNLERASGVRACLQRLEAARARAWEARVRRSFDAAIYVSRQDAEAAGLPGPAVHVVPNGVLHPEFPVDEHDGAAVLGFLGNLHYPPNAVAARRLRDRIFPAVRTRVPEATLLLIGRGPPADLRTAVDGVVVTGEVESIWEPMARVTVFVLPVDTGAGMQNKLLEAMAIGAAVVTTPGCAKAIGATAGVHCLVAHTDDEFVTATLGLLRHDSLRRDVGAIGRQLVAERFEWPTLLPRFEQVVFGTDR